MRALHVTYSTTIYAAKHRKKIHLTNWARDPRNTRSIRARLASHLIKTKGIAVPASSLVFSHVAATGYEKPGDYLTLPTGDGAPAIVAQTEREWNVYFRVAQ